MFSRSKSSEMSMLKQANTILEEFLMLNENVVKLLKASMWDLATCENGEPNVVPVAFKDVTEDGKLVVGDVFMETTLNNVRANGGKIAISVYDAQSLEHLRNEISSFKRKIILLSINTPSLFSVNCPIKSKLFVL